MLPDRTSAIRCTCSDAEAKAINAGRDALFDSLGHAAVSCSNVSNGYRAHDTHYKNVSKGCRMRPVCDMSAMSSDALPAVQILHQGHCIRGLTPLTVLLTLAAET
jgi:hypothetical protein